VTHPERQDDGPAISRDIALATWGLFVGLSFMMVAAGMFGTLLGVRSELTGLSTGLSSLISASYYVGFLAGSKVTLESLSKVGHIRVYAALASMLAAAMISVGLVEAPIAWVGLRFATGLCIAGLYVVAESWLNDLANNNNRGRLLAIYNVITTAAFGGGQLLINAFDSRIVTGYAVAAIFTSLAVAPVALSEASAPPVMKERDHVSLRELAKTVPTGVGSCLLVGVAHGALGGMAAIYATRVGLSLAQTSLFVAAPMLGGVLFQWPISAASDDVDRRAVGVAASVVGVIAAVLLLLGPATSPMAIVLMMFLGGASYPLYSIAGAYTNDWVDPVHVNAAASQLIVLYGIGAIVGPFVAGGMMIVIGPVGYYWTAIILHAFIAVFFAYRMKAWRSPLAKRPWDEVSLPARAFFVPATVVSIGRRYRYRDSEVPETKYSK
jgi:MFS family permease